MDLPKCSTWFLTEIESSVVVKEKVDDEVTWAPVENSW